MTYDYRVLEVLRVVDGDTVDLRIDLGFHMSATLRFRLYGINTPERKQAGWAEATNFTALWLTSAISPDNAPELRARTYKADSFGRWLAEVYYVTSTGLEMNLCKHLIANGHAVEYK